MRRCDNQFVNHTDLCNDSDTLLDPISGGDDENV